jgi:hypothetical protein
MINKNMEQNREPAKVKNKKMSDQDKMKLHRDQ